MVHTTQNPVVVPADATQLAAYNRKNNKGKILILDGVKDHCILLTPNPHDWVNLCK